MWNLSNNDLSNIENNHNSDNNSFGTMNSINEPDTNNNNIDKSDSNDDNNTYLNFILYTDQTENRHASKIPSKFTNKKNWKVSNVFITRWK